MGHLHKTTLTNFLFLYKDERPIGMIHYMDEVDNPSKHCLEVKIVVHEKNRRGLELCHNKKKAM